MFKIYGVETLYKKCPKSINWNCRIISRFWIVGLSPCNRHGWETIGVLSSSSSSSYTPSFLDPTLSNHYAHQHPFTYLIRASWKPHCIRNCWEFIRNLFGSLSIMSPTWFASAYRPCKPHAIVFFRQALVSRTTHRLRGVWPGLDSTGLPFPINMPSDSYRQTENQVGRETDMLERDRYASGQAEKQIRWQTDR